MMRTVRSISLVAAFVAVFAIVPMQPALAALPCNPLPQLSDSATARTSTPTPQATPVSLSEVLAGDPPANRSDTTPMTDDGQINSFSIESSAAAIFRCITYGQQSIFATNATPTYVTDHFGTSPDDIKDDALSTDHVFIIQFQNTMKLGDGRYLTDYSVLADDHFIKGEMVFVDHQGELYLDASTVTIDQAPSGVEHDISVDAWGVNRTELDIHIGDEINFFAEGRDSVDITITDESGNVIFNGWAVPEGFVGDVPRHSFIAIDVAPGTYTITLTVSDLTAGVVELTISKP